MAKSKVDKFCINRIGYFIEKFIGTERREDNDASAIKKELYVVEGLTPRGLSVSGKSNVLCRRKGTGHLVGATPSGKPALERSTTDMGSKLTRVNAFPP